MASINRHLCCLLLLLPLTGMPETIETCYHIGNWSSQTKESFQTVTVDGAILSALPGDPLLPWLKVVLLLPPGQKAKTVTVIREEEQPIPGRWLLMPRQPVVPLSSDSSHRFLMNKTTYLQREPYPSVIHGTLSTQCFKGFSVALCTFTPLSYQPLAGQLTLYRKITVRVETEPMQHNEKPRIPALVSPQTRTYLHAMIQNREMSARYPDLPAVRESYQYLIITPLIFQNEFQSLITLNDHRGLATRVITIDSILTTTHGYDVPEKIRNFIIAQYQTYGIDYVLLAGDHSLVKSRGLYCKVQSGNTVYEDYSIPADLYYSGLDGTFDANGNHIYGELADNADLLPDISVGRFPVSDTAGLRNMIRKTVAYQTNPVLGELNRPLMVGEFMYFDPLTLGGPFMELLIDDHADNGYFTQGIPSAANVIAKLYDSVIFPTSNVGIWTKAMLLAAINRGTSFMHHLGHASTTSLLRLDMGDIADNNFPQVNGISHNFTLLYTQGCYCGSFDNSGGCIAAKSVSIKNFLVAGIFNSRYGWFNQGTTDGPSEHLHREFVSAMYNDTMPERHFGTAQMISKIETAPWVGLPGEFEPGAQRWCHFCCNVFGDPALEVWTGEPASFTTLTWTGNISSDWNNPQNWNPQRLPASLHNVVILPAVNQPQITSAEPAFCHDLVLMPGSNLTIQPGKKLIVRGTLNLSNIQ